MKAILIITYILNCMSFLTMLTYGFIPENNKKLNKVLNLLVVFLLMGSSAFVIVSFHYIWCFL